MRQAIMRPSRSLVRAGGGSLPNVLHHRARRAACPRQRMFARSAPTAQKLVVVENLRSLDKDDLRARWCKTFGKALLLRKVPCDSLGELGRRCRTGRDECPER